MVRHGRLSKGCQTCRKRKIKCDQGLPACSQCLKAGWKCPQYGDGLERMFQHQDPRDINTPGKHKSKNLISKASNEPFHSTARLPLWKHTPSATAKALYSTPNVIPHVNLPKEIIQPIDYRAIDFFLSTHVFQECGLVRGYYEYLFTLNNDGSVNKNLFTSLSAVALAAYAYTFRYPELLKEARRRYGSSLQLISKALSSREEAIKDSTLVSILLTNTFETLTCENIKSLSKCDTHMDGTMAVISLRGPQMVETHNGLQLFLQLCWCLSLNCLLHSIRIPDELIEFRTYAASYLETDDPAWKLSEMIIKLARFRADIKDQILLDDGSLLDAALEIDSELSALADSMPAQWQFKIVTLKDESEFVFGTFYHVYPDLWVARTWNILRTCRILLHKEICNRLEHVLAISPLSFSATENFIYQESIKTLQQMSFEICATVPQYSEELTAFSSGLQQTEKSMSLQNTSPPNVPCSSSLPTTASIYFLLWPLLNAGQVADSDMQRNWIIDCSHYMGRLTGIQSFFLLASILERRQEIYT